MYVRFSARKQTETNSHQTNITRPARLGDIFKKNVVCQFLFFIYNKRKKYLIEYQENPGARTWLHFHKAPVCFDILV